ncbi:MULTISPECIES: hypothetical protein [unclassified Micromonospora]|uniref:hypothetical protein n=1 Tax=unclassified Micromonospora TaxID=2617518 RepID=UPI003A881A88
MRAQHAGADSDPAELGDPRPRAAGGGPAARPPSYAGVGAEAAREAVEAVVVSYPFVTFVDRAAYAEARTGTVDTVLRFVLALLALAIFVSLLGLANTLTLSVVERIREPALLRVSV